MDEKEMETIKLVLDGTGHVTSFAVIGEIEGATDYSGPFPENFFDDPFPTRYLLENGVLVEDPNFVAPAIPEDNGPSLGDQLKQVSQNLAKASFQLMTTQQQNQAAAKQNAAMAFEIMQLKQALAAKEPAAQQPNGGVSNV
ncbi:DUF2977 domain-containing protein [Enterococcus faecium]